MIVLIMPPRFLEKVEMGFYGSIVAGVMKGSPNIGGNSLPALSVCVSRCLCFASFRLLPPATAHSSSQQSQALRRAGGLPRFRALCTREG